MRPAALLAESLTLDRTPAGSLRPAPDPGSDDISARGLFYRPCWLFVPESYVGEVGRGDPVWSAWPGVKFCSTSCARRASQRRVAA